MIILTGAALAAVLAVVLLGLSFARRPTAEFTRPLGIFAVILAVALGVLYMIH